MRPRAAGITLVEITAGITILGAVTALVIPALTHASRVEKLLVCQDHLKTMFEAKGRAPAPGNNVFGRAYWTRLTTTTPPLLDPKVLRCPFVESPQAPFCQYFGPAPNWEKEEANSPLGCDMELSHSEDGHEGGNVLRKSGEIVTDQTGIWWTAVKQGKCRP